MTLRIVHLEDTKPLRDILKATLTAIHPDFELFQFSTTDAALDYIQQNGDKVDLFLLDVRVPGVVDGLGLAEIIKQQGCPGLIVMTSAYMSPGRERLEALDAHWFQKPWQIQDVQEMLRLASMTQRPAS